MTPASVRSRRLPAYSGRFSIASGLSGRRPQQLVMLFALLVLLLAFADLLGWLLHIPALTSFLPHYATMKPNTALCLALLGAALWLQREAGPPGRATPVRIAADLLLILALLVSALSFTEYVAHVSLGLDQILLAVPADRAGDPPGRMSIGASVSILLTASAYLLMDRSSRISVGLLLAGSVIAVSGLVGFLFQAGPLLGVPWLKSLAVHTAGCLFLLQVAGLAARPQREPFRSLSGIDRPDRHSAPLLLSVTILPVLLALPVAVGLRTRLYDASFALSLLLVLLIFLQTLLLWRDNMVLAKVQAQLRESESRSTHILQSIGDGVIVTDASTHVTRMNAVAEALTGWKTEEATGRPLAEIFRLIHEATRKPVENPAEKVKRLDSIVGLANHTLLIARDGQETAIDDSGAPVRRPDGTLSDIVVIFRNVTDRRQAEKALLQSEKLAAVGRLAASIAHEINNPLESLTNLLYLARTADGRESSEAYLETAERELRRVSVISNQTLRFHKQSTHPGPVTGEDLIDSVLSMYQGRTHNSRVEVERRMRARNPVVCFDGEIRQVLGNLVGNAIDALPPAGGRLLIRTREGRHWHSGRKGLIFTIADTGTGMSEQTRGKIFHPFFTTKGEVGNGLGLWISQEIVARHEGSLQIRSRQGNGKSGTVFTIFLPSLPSQQLRGQPSAV